MALIYDKEVRIYRTLCGSDNNNTYLIVCPVTMESIIIDAPLDPGGLLQEARDTQVKLVLITHRHKDHWEGSEGSQRRYRRSGGRSHPGRLRHTHTSGYSDTGQGPYSGQAQ